MSAPAEIGWTPLRVPWPQGRPCIDWCRLGDHRFTDPFFEQTINHALRDPARMLFRRLTPIESLEAFVDHPSSLRPSGFVFHLSRCGSTLLAQMLAALPESVVISEAPPIDQVLTVHQRDPRVTHGQRLAWVRGMIAALGQRRRGDERHYIVKFDSWHTLELPLLREAFPEVPWVFLYRDPVEVLVSQQRMRGIQMLPQVISPARFGLDPAAALQLSPDEYCAQVLARVCDAALAETARGGGRLVNYAQLPDVLWQSLAGFFGIGADAANRELWQRVTTRSAKAPGLPHADDRAAKQEAASPELRALADRWVGDVYAELEAVRTAQPGR